ncbi:MAG: terminase small subunit [Desulfosalsimonadaceae bacterium]
MNDREEAFCRGIVTGSSKIDAYRNAGYHSEKANTLYIGAVRLYKKTKIQTRLAELREEIKVRYALTEDNVFKQCASILNADARNYTTWGPRGVTLVDSTNLTEEQALAVEEVSETVTKDGGSVKFKLHSKTKALEIGAKLLGMMKERQEFGLDAATIDLILSALPPEYAKAVRAKLAGTK